VKKKLFTIIFSVNVILLFLGMTNSQRIIEKNKLDDFILPVVGTMGEGNVFPGPTVPHGMVQFSPDTDKWSWETASGYEYRDKNILGFSMRHLSGTGIPDLGDFLFISSTGSLEFVPGIVKKKRKNGEIEVYLDPKKGYATPFSHKDEVIRAGYYMVKLPEYGIKMELAATDRAGIMKITFPKTGEANILMDLSHVLQWKVIWSRVRRENKTLITGFHSINGWAKERYLYFAAEYSRPYDDFGIVMNGKKVFYNTRRFRSKYEAAGKDLQYYTRYSTKDGEVIFVKIGISAVSTEGALKNLRTEIPDWNFNKVVKKAKIRWNREMSKMRIEGTLKEKQIFYTSLYHSLLTPVTFEDVDGKYRGFDNEIHKAKGFKQYSIFSLWDTYRAEHPLFTLIQPARDSDMINTMLSYYDQSVDNLLPVWSLDNNETWCMIGYHAVPVIADAMIKNIKGFNWEKAYEACKATAMNPDYDSVKEYANIGYVPFDHENESVSKTLEYAYDDFCIAQMAKKLNKKDDYLYFLKRAKFYKNLFDPESKLMRGKDSKGKWRTPFYPHQYIGEMDKRDITEGTNWQYSWYVPHDVQGLVDLMGGDVAFEKMLDQLFTYRSAENISKGSEDILGRIGEYWHGNEPAHHVVFLYNYVRKPWKTQKLVREIMNRFYGNKPDSLSGNDDCGQMSAWYIFNALGFYPVAPASGYYVIGTPCAKEIIIKLGNKKTFKMRAKNFSDKNIYIQSVTLNGKQWNKTYIPFEQIHNGGELIYILGEKPNKKWGTASDSIPPSISTGRSE